VVNSFAVTVRLAILKDYILKDMKKTSCIKISNIMIKESFLPFVVVEISVKNIKTWFDPKASKKLESDLRNLVQAFMDAHQLCSVRAFELDTAEWQQRGCNFIDAVSSWDFGTAQKMIISLIKDGKTENI
jgi:hypothetical protein